MCMLHMFVRDDLPLHLRSGTKAWADNDDAAAALTYLEVPLICVRACYAVVHRLEIALTYNTCARTCLAARPETTRAGV